MSKPKRSFSKRGKDDASYIKARSIVAKLDSIGVKLLALDFDKTIVDVHTAGFWKQGTQRLSEHVRPAFIDLIRAALNSNLHTCIVTYSMQPELILDVLSVVLPKCDISKVIIRANSKDWLPPQSACSSSLGKEQHIAWITTELFNRHHVIIQTQEICLMDDDEDNVRVAIDFGHYAYLVPDDVNLESISHFVDSLAGMKKSFSAT